MNLENYIESQYRELSLKGFVNPEFLELYEGVEHAKLKEIFSSLHKQYLELFKSMNERLPTESYEAHFWAEPSRQLLSVIEITMGLYRALKKSSHAFDIDEYYMDLLNKCQSFLKRSGGSSIPRNMEKVNLYYTIPIFNSAQIMRVVGHNRESFMQLKLIGEGSYAKVFKYRDEFYNKSFVVKRAKSNLSSKELERFKREFEEMRKLSSPYIVEVYNFEDARNEYVMEYLDFSLDHYIGKNNDKMTDFKRRNISFQILRAFSYLESKKILHRDISPNNILIKEYEDTMVVKVADFGLVKLSESNLTSMNTELKGYFNDPALVTEGFENYTVQHETYALTKLLYFVMTGRVNLSSMPESKLKDFVHKGLNPDKTKRYQSIDEIESAFRDCQN